ncbi:putative 4-mercaptohistidine N1-methyltransferase [Pelagicoccus sp. SDUM812005]|uniref:putative 4-mercaptohistidine N1-methyltransferase n=1 Tax=Pelagicoccus sp. SDUM812005 TaxID=3041257 RepID=UPI00280FC2AE|nr:putative 4-mercaptohistidine N1-methyltransferase [Pelagicoccus sp. SDUM812005]MDQ8179232.1 putative 4-mercaptohistidine N1-methyltransferase [Pelagicoccus sp. SDUM812005]
MPNIDSFYETDKAISEYLLFHYGTADHFQGPPEALDFSKRCAELATRRPLKHGRALDLGCAVGRSACELSAYFEETIGIDFSHGLIEAAERIRDGASLEAEIAIEGDLTERITLQRPANTRPHCLSFRQGDALALPSDLGTFDFALLANLIDRLPDPAQCLRSIGQAINTGGILAITSPYTWLEEYTPKEKWLGGFQRDGAPVRSYQTLQSLLAPEFDEIEALDMPFLIREHARKNQYSIAHATLWRKR